MHQARIVFVFAALLCSAGVVWAESPHFVKVTANLTDDSVQVCWKEAGLGNNQNIIYTASANGTFTYICVNNGGQCPKAANKKKVSVPVTATTPFNSGDNGQISQCLTLSPPDAPESFSCDGKGESQTVTLSEVSFSNLQITDDTNLISKNATPRSISATLFECP